MGTLGRIRRSFRGDSRLLLPSFLVRDCTCSDCGIEVTSFDEDKLKPWVTDSRLYKYPCPECNKTLNLPKRFFDE